MQAFTPRIDPVPLFNRLASVGRRLRMVIVLRGACTLAALLLGSGLVLGWLDWRLDVPPLVRALGLAAVLAAAGAVFVGAVWRPLRRPATPLALALAVEERHPELNDALASAIQFLQRDDGAAWGGAAGLRREAVRRALLRADDYEFEALIDSRGAWRAAAALGAVLAVLVPLRFLAPVEVGTAFARLTEPFAGHRWTQLYILAPERFPARMARGQAFELKFAVGGVLPHAAEVTIRPDEGAPEEVILPVGEPGEGEGAAEVDADGRRVLTCRFESNQVPQSFRLRVRANDADTGWRRVAVLPPPALVPLDGRPSPQVRLEFPRYTRQPPADLPGGTGTIDAVAGTRARIRAAADRPLAAAELVYRPETRAWVASGMLMPLAPGHALGAAGSFAASREVWAPVPARLGAQRRRLELAFVPRLPGLYELRFTDDTGLPGARLFNVRTRPDAPPVAHLDRPSPARDVLDVLPEAVVPFQARCRYADFGLRSVALGYRFAEDQPPRRVVLFDGRMIDPVQQVLAPVLAAAPALPLPALAGVGGRPRPEWAFEGWLELRRFAHPDGSPLREGDRLLLRVAADDYDDVTGDKPPGRSEEVVLRIVSRPGLEARLQGALLELRPDLERLLARQRSARAQVRRALERLRSEGRLRPEELAQLAAAEQEQQQIRATLSAPGKGLRDLLDRLRRAATAGALPRSPVARRVEAVAAELDRLALEEAEQIPPLIAAARTEHEQGTPPPPSPGRRDPLARAEWHQRQMEEGLRGLLERLEPWSGAAEVRGEARGLLGEVRRQIENTRRMSEQIPLGRDPARLTPGQREQLDRAAARQDGLAERARQLGQQLGRRLGEKESALLERLEQLGELERQAQAARAAAGRAEPGSAEARRAGAEARALEMEAEHLRDSIAGLEREIAALRGALESGDATELRNRLDAAAGQTRRNRLGNALGAQQGAAENLGRIIEALGEPEGDSPDRLMKKMDDAADRLRELAGEQERLREQAEAGDPEALAREQEQLRRLARELERQLRRAEADAAAEALRRAGRAMDEAAREMEQGRPPGAAQADALERLGEAEQRLRDERRAAEEELHRERTGELTGEVRALRARQQAAAAERARIHREVLKTKRWERPVLASLQELGDAQGALAGEVRALVEKRFDRDPVFGRMLRHAAGAMEAAGERIGDWKQDALDFLPPNPVDPELETLADREVARKQALALRRLDQILEALEAGPERPGPPPEQGPGGGGPGGAGQAGADPGRRLPPLAQLRAMRALQQEIKERTEAFAKANPNPDELGEEAREELDELRRAQVEIAEMFQELQAAGPERGEP